MPPRMLSAKTMPVPESASLRLLGVLSRRRDLWRFVSEFCRAAERAGGSSYLVGGIVRDLLEGRPGRDVDLMATGIGFGTLGKILRSLPQKKLGIERVFASGKQFAVYKVATSWSREDIDVALARSERSTGPGHRQFAVRTEGVGARDDAARRDFTINSLMVAFRVSGKRVTGEVIDFFGGMDDLRRKRIRGVGDPVERIREDPLRMLRAIRLKNERPGFLIEKRTWQAIRTEAKGLIGTISGERFVGELAKSLAADPSGTVSDMYRAGILPILFPEIPDWGGGPLSRMRKRYALLEGELGRPLPETLLFANLLVDAAGHELRGIIRSGKRDPAARKGAEEPLGALPEGNAFRLPRTNALARRLHFPRVRKAVRMVEDLFRLWHYRMLPNPHARIEMIFSRWEDPDLLHALYAAARHAASRKVEDFRPILAEAARRRPLLSGDDVLALGIPPGPLVESILERVREATITGVVSGREEARRLAAFLYGDEKLLELLHRGRRSRRRVSNNPTRAR